MRRYRASAPRPVLPRKTLDYLAAGASEGSRNGELFDAACQFRDAGFVADLEKYLTAALDGWRVLRLAEPFITAPMVERIITLVRTAGVKSV